MMKTAVRMKKKLEDVVAQLKCIKKHQDLGG
jgi:hypothetical protein